MAMSLALCEEMDQTVACQEILDRIFDSAMGKTAPTAGNLAKETTQRTLTVAA